MIRPEELRKRNRIQVNFLSIQEIEVSSIGEYFINDDSGLTYDILEGIPLTEEWLIKAGFEKEEVDAVGIATWNEWYLGGLQIDSTGTEAGCENDFYYQTTDRKVKFVHQLQNLYFALSGEELIFNK